MKESLHYTRPQLLIPKMTTPALLLLLLILLLLLSPPVAETLLGARQCAKQIICIVLLNTHKVLLLIQFYTRE